MVHPPSKTAIPTALDQLLGFSLSCACGKSHTVDLQDASIGDGVLGDVVDFARNIQPGGRVTVITDKNVLDIAGNQVFEQLRSGGYQTSLLVLKNGAGGRPHADQSALADVESALTDADIAVAVGSGTINDLTKLGSFNRGIPYLTVATAPSMNGYTSGIAAIMIQGLKRTVECQQPRAIVADLAILSGAPMHLITAGLGDLESKPTALADYRLGGFLMNAHYCQVPETVVFAAEQRAAAHAAGIRNRDPEAIAALTEALILSGISMKLAGSSSPASGGEHLISHYFDMTAPEEGRIEGWHGAQVGVATIVTATLFEHLRAMDPQQIDINEILRTRPKKHEIEAAIVRRHGKRSAEVLPEFFAKYTANDQLEKILHRIQNEWDDIWSHLDPILRPGAKVREILSAAGAPTTVQQLGLNPAHLRSAFLAAREIRSRYTVLDFCADLGQLESMRDSILNASGCLASS